MTSIRPWVAAGLVVLTAWSASLVSAQVPVTVQELVELTQVVSPGAAPVSVFTVPSGSRLVITDVILTNAADTAACGVSVARAAETTVTGALCVPARTSLQISLVTGIEFAPGQAVLVANVGPEGSAPVSVHLRGFLAAETG